MHSSLKLPFSAHGRRAREVSREALKRLKKISAGLADAARALDNGDLTLEDLDAEMDRAVTDPFVPIVRTPSGEQK